MEWKSVLVVEDDDVLRELISCAFRDKGYSVYEAADGKEAIEVYRENEASIRLIILDVMMPVMDGWSVLKRIREFSRNVVIIMLSSRDDDSDELLGYHLGVDEYVTKPVNTKVLLARSERLLERIVMNMNGSMHVIKTGPLEINKEGYLVKVDGTVVDFAPKEYELLVYLVENQGKVLSREKILNTVWGYDYFGDDRVVDTHVKKIRKKLGHRSELIQTVVRVGYKFDVS